MRSSNSKSGKSVSICNEPYPNGPCPKKDGEVETEGGCKADSPDEEENEHITEDRVHAVASKVVEDVVRLASQTASERIAAIASHATSSTVEQTEDIPPETTPNQTATGSKNDSSQSSKLEKLKRLPTIQIDTVPSIPSSPTEWQAPSTITEEEEEDEDILNEGHIHLAFDSTSGDSKAPPEVQDFATSYINDLVSKAMELAEEKLRAKDAEIAKEVAAQVVEDIITRANDKAFEKLTAGLEFPETVPSIQIDTVPSMPPSPTWEEEEETRKQTDVEQSPKVVVKKRKKPQFVFHEDEDDITANAQTKLQKLIKHSEAPIEIREFASSYVKDVISKAITMAEEKLVNTVPFNFEDVDLMKASGPWYIRAREALLRVLRSACFCTPRRNDT